MTQNIKESNKRRTKKTLLEERQEKAARERYMEYKKRLKTALEAKTEWLKTMAAHYLLGRRRRYYDRGAKGNF